MSYPSLSSLFFEFVATLVLGCIFGAILHKSSSTSNADASLSSSQVKSTLSQLRLVFFADGVRNEAEYRRNENAMKKLNSFIYTRDQRALEWLGDYAVGRLEEIGKGSQG